MVSQIEEAEKTGCLGGSIVVLATDNIVVERALYKGNSSSKILFKLVLRLKDLELTYGCKILATHVLDTRMISQEINGIPRGQLHLGVSRGENILKHCHWGKFSITIHPKLLAEVKGWFKRHFVVLKPKDWFKMGHNIHT